jgi:hypothetical protein
MAAGLGFKTFSTGDVLTAGDVNGYLMQGVLVFADATARDAAITSPEEGQVVYLKSTDEVLVYSGSAYVSVGGASPLTTKGDLYTYSTVDARLAVGANGTVLTADSAEATGLKWVTPAASSPYDLLSTTALTGVASVTISAINQTYTELIVLIDGITASTFQSDMNLRMNGVTTGQSLTSWATGSNTSNGSRGSATPNMGNNVNRLSGATSNIWIVRIPFYASTSLRKLGSWNAYWTSASGELVAAAGTITPNTTSAITSFEVRMDGTATFLSGNVFTYGVK